MTRVEVQGSVLAADEAMLRIYATSDLHMRLLPYDYAADRPAAAPSLTGVAALLETLRRNGPPALLLDCGDFLQGTPMADYLGLTRGLPGGELHPMIAAMNALGVDAATLGNHEFTYGLEFLRRALAGAAFPVVCANLTEAGSARALVAPHTLIHRTVRTGDGRRHRLRLGILGLTLPQVVEWEHGVLQGRLVARDLVETAGHAVPALRAAGADLVIALAHTGIVPAGGQATADDVGLPLARVPGIDALVLGHSHLVFPGPAFEGAPDADVAAGTLHGKPAVLPGRWGSHLGVIDLTLRAGPRGGARWQVARHRVRAQPAPAQPPEPPGRAPRAVRAAAASLHAATLAHVRHPVGHSPVPLHSYFARVTDCAALRLVAAAQRHWARARLRGRPEADLPMLSITAPFKSGDRGGPGHFTDIPAGPLRLTHVFDLYDFPNTLQLIRLSGAEVIDWLERIASFYAEIGPGSRDAALLQPEVPGYNFDLIDGLEYVIDVKRPARFAPDGSLRHPGARRVRATWPCGRMLRPGDRLVAVLNSYRASGGGGFPGTGPDRGITTPDSPVRSAILDHLRRGQAMAAPGSGSWRLVLPRRSAVLFDTGPGAAPHLADLADWRPDWCGLAGTGLARVRLHGAG